MTGKWQVTELFLHRRPAASALQIIPPVLFCFSARDAVRAIKKRLQQSANKNFAVFMFTLTVSMSQ